MDIHVVRAGETVSSVAARYGVPAGILAGVNGVAPDAPLAVGQTLVIRHPRELHTVASGESVYSIALRYGLSVRTLYQNNPALGGRSALYPGQTLVIAYDDTPTRTLAVNAYSYPFIRGGLLDAALPYLTYLTPFTYGINADGTLLREALNPLGCPVIVALAPKTSAAQRGLLYEAHDYTLLGAAANAVFLMTYEWGYAYGPPMAVAPLGQVRAVLDYALTAVAPEKIFMGIPLYGYDWPLPFVSGETRAESLSPVQAVERALRHDIAIQYDAAAQAPYYHYTDRGGREHAVWFEDARSIEAKLHLADEYHLQGVGYWNLTRPFPQNWAVLASLFDIETLL